MTNRDKVNALSNREMAVLWDDIKSDCAGSNCVFNACPDCGGDCLKGFEAWLGLECEAEENPPAEEREITDAKKIRKMIKLTIANSHKPIYINPDWIMYIRESSHSDETFIALGAQGATVIVEEDLATIEMRIS